MAAAIRKYQRQFKAAVDAAWQAALDGEQPATEVQPAAEEGHQAASSSMPAEIIPVGSTLEAHSLFAAAALNSVRGTVLTIQGERVHVEFPGGVQAL